MSVVTYAWHKECPAFCFSSGVECFPIVACYRKQGLPDACGDSALVRGARDEGGYAAVCGIYSKCQLAGVV